MKKSNLKTSLKAMKSLAFEEVDNLAEVGAKAIYAASRNKSTVLKAAGGAAVFNYGVENDSLAAKIIGGGLIASAAMEVGDLIKDFNDFNSNDYLASLGELDIEEEEEDDEVEVIG